MERLQIKAKIEALVFASESPLKIDKIIEILGSDGVENAGKRDVAPILDDIADEYKAEGKGFYLAEVAEGYQFRTKKEHAALLQKLKAKRPPRFGRAAMEVLSIIAYRQPVTRAELEELRGVDSGGAVRGLLEKRLIKILGRKEVPGKPMIYGTSKTFLEYFNLRDLSQLPTLKEFIELEKDEEDQVISKLQKE